MVGKKIIILITEFFVSSKVFSGVSHSHVYIQIVAVIGFESRDVYSNLTRVSVLHIFLVIFLITCLKEKLVLLFNFFFGITDFVAHFDFVGCVTP